MTVCEAALCRPGTGRLILYDSVKRARPAPITYETMNQTTTIDTVPFWEILCGLPCASIPDDLSEIDADWCFYSLEEHACKLSDEIMADNLDLIPWQTLRDFAYDLRDLWHTARAEAAEFTRGWG